MEKKHPTPKFLISLAPEYIVTCEDEEIETCGSFPSLQRAREYAENMARANKGVTFNLYQVNRPTFYKESCRLNQVQWFVDSTLQGPEEHNRG